MKNVLYCKNCGKWTFYGENNWKDLKPENFIEFRFNPKDYGISPIICPECRKNELFGNSEQLKGGTK